MVENEHFCLNLAAACGLLTAGSEILHFEDEVAICIRRFDRIEKDGKIARVHQEDLCQALAVHPQRKYQNEGGPGPRDILTLLAEASSQPKDDVRRFFEALAFNWLVAGTDAHAKNYAILIGRQTIRLAPLYDIASALPYPALDQRRLKLAMKIGNHYEWWMITARDWMRLRRASPLDVETGMAILREFAMQLPDAAAGVSMQMRRAGHSHGIAARLVDGIAVSCHRALRLLDQPPEIASAPRS